MNDESTLPFHNEPTSQSGKLLWLLLPEVYRNRDGTYGEDSRRPNKPLQQRGDLARYLDSYGVLLDQVRNTILQRLEDSSPETCQDWLIPYFADLLDVKLVSPDIEGQRMEVARAVSWRQRKGTMVCTEEVAREVGRYEQVVLAVPELEGEMETYRSIPSVVVQEGYRRVATTIRIGDPLPSLHSLGLESNAYTESSSSVHSVLRPGLPAGTIDFRTMSRAENVVVGTPLSQIHIFEGKGHQWQQTQPRSLPCFPDTYQDVSVRTVDVRAPNWNAGHYHPHRVLFYTAPRDGFFYPAQFKVEWNTLWSWFELFNSLSSEFVEENDPVSRDLIRERVLESVMHDSETIVLLERLRITKGETSSRQRIIGVAVDDASTEVNSQVETIGDVVYQLRTGFQITEENINGVRRLTLQGIGEQTPKISTEDDIELNNVIAADEYIIEHLVFDGHLILTNTPSGLKRLQRTAIKKLTIDSFVASEPIDVTLPRSPYIVANNCLFEELSVLQDGLCRLEYCTVLSSINCNALEASDSILLAADFSSFNELFLRYCCVPELAVGKPDADKGRAFEESITRIQPLFLNKNFGHSGCAVLHPASNGITREGAEDGGELGCYHHRHFVLREQAVLDKLKEFLPVTQEPVLIPHRDWDTPTPISIA